MEKREVRKAAQKDRERTEILDVAVESFAKKGFAGTSMNEIAEKSGYSVGHIYNVIGNKEAVFDAVTLREGEAMFEAVSAALAGEEERPARSVIDRLIDTVLAFFDEHRAFFKIYLDQSSGGPALPHRSIPERLKELKQKNTALVRTLFERAVVEGGRRSEVSPEDLAVGYQGLMLGFMIEWAESNYQENISDKADVIRRILWCTRERVQE